jgi:hypothetical protein
MHTKKATDGPYIDYFLDDGVVLFKCIEEHKDFSGFICLRLKCQNANCKNIIHEDKISIAEYNSVLASCIKKHINELTLLEL